LLQNIKKKSPKHFRDDILDDIKLLEESQTKEEFLFRYNLISKAWKEIEDEELT